MPVQFGGPILPAAPGAAEMVLPPVKMPTLIQRVGEKCMYSTMLIAAGAQAATEHRLFTTPVGQVGQGFANALSRAETNLRVGGVIPGDLAFVAHEIAIVPNANIRLADLRRYYNSAIVSYQFQDEEIEIAPYAIMGQGGGIFGLSADTGALEGDRTQLNHGIGNLWKYNAFPTILAPHRQFAVAIRFGSNPGAQIDGANNVTMANATTQKVCLIGTFRTMVASG